MERTGELEAFVYGCLGIIDDSHCDTRFLCRDESYSQSLITSQRRSRDVPPASYHLPSTNNSQLLDLMCRYI